MYFVRTWKCCGAQATDLDFTAPPTFLPAMTARPLREMTLDDLFDLEAKYSAHIGHSGVTEDGFKRHQAKLAAAARGLVKRGKRRATKSLVPAR